MAAVGLQQSADERKTGLAPTFLPTFLRAFRRPQRISISCS